MAADVRIGQEEIETKKVARVLLNRLKQFFLVLNLRQKAASRSQLRAGPFFR
jgi:hypothetical protein